jgi:ABC-2 type transport system permease protein
MSSPIADLSYRNYDGPLEPPAYRWWSIAAMSMHLASKKKLFWILSVLSASWYVILMIIFYFMDALTPAEMGDTNPLLQQVVWKNQFLHAFSISQFFLLLIALVIGAGAIANDNRSNALLVYLSRPVSRIDYLIGKWLGIFIPITMVVAIPALLFFLYGYMSFRDYGFLTEDPKLPFRLMGMVLVPGFFHASLVLGVSSLFNQGRMAGATYAGSYFMLLFFTKAMQLAHANAIFNDRQPSRMLETLYYVSIDGINIALAKIILSTYGGGLIPGAPQGRRGTNPNEFAIPPPDATLFFGAFFFISLVAIFVAWTRVRAVEVVGG